MTGMIVVIGIVGYAALTAGLIRLEEGEWPVVSRE